MCYIWNVTLNWPDLWESALSLALEHAGALHACFELLPYSYLSQTVTLLTYLLFRSLETDGCGWERCIVCLVPDCPEELCCPFGGQTHQREHWGWKHQKHQGKGSTCFRRLFVGIVWLRNCSLSHGFDDVSWRLHIWWTTGRYLLALSFHVQRNAIARLLSPHGPAWGKHQEVKDKNSPLCRLGQARKLWKTSLWPCSLALSKLMIQQHASIWKSATLIYVKQRGCAKMTNGGVRSPAAHLGGLKSTDTLVAVEMFLIRHCPLCSRNFIARSLTG